MIRIIIMIISLMFTYVASKIISLNLSQKKTRNPRFRRGNVLWVIRMLQAIVEINVKKT